MRRRLLRRQGRHARHDGRLRVSPAKNGGFEPFCALDICVTFFTIARTMRNTAAARRGALVHSIYADEPRARPDWIDDRLLRSGQVALLFQVSRRTISDWARSGKLRSIVTPGGHRRFRARDVRAVLESQRVGHAQAPENGILRHA